MTVVTRFMVDRRPVLIGDLLLSGKPLPTTKIALPNLRDIETLFSPSDEKVPRSLKQKLTVIGDNVVIGWAGRSQTAADVIGTLVQKSAKEQFAKHSFFNHLETLNESIWNEVGLAGFILDGIQLFSFGQGKSYSECETKHLGKVGLLGSGSADMRRIASLAEGSVGESGSSNQAQRAVAAGLSIAANALALELTNYDSLRQFYGGGYEIATLSGGKFEKVDDIMYLFWEVRMDEQKPRLDMKGTPFHVSHYKYHDEVLVVGDLDLGTETPSEVLFPIPQVHEEWSASEQIPSASYDAQWLCNIILLKGRNLDGLHLVNILARPQIHEPSWIQFSREGNQINIAVQKRLQKDIMTHVMEAIGDEQKRRKGNKAESKGTELNP